MFVLFSNRLGCAGSLLVSVVDEGGDIDAIVHSSARGGEGSLDQLSRVRLRNDRSVSPAPKGVVGRFVSGVSRVQIECRLFASQNAPAPDRLPCDAYPEVVAGDEESIELTTPDAGRLAMRFSLVPRGPEGILAKRVP